MIGIQEYVGFLRREYLDDFVSRGGAAVKFLVPSEDVNLDDVHGALRAAAADTGYVYAHVDAAMARVHMIDQLFFAVAQQIDWEGLAANFLRGVLVDAGFPPADGSTDLTLDGLARHHQFDRGELNRSVNRQLQQELFYDFEMAQEFRIAMLRLCQSVLADNNAAAAEREAILEWLRGELKHIARLKSALIFRRIARHNARHLLFSLARWVRRNGFTGLLLDLDITRCAVTRRGTAPGPGDVYYSKAAVMDAYEVLRQLVDATDELSHCAVVVTAAPEFLTDDSRGLAAYTALQLRIWDEVRDRSRVNPLSSLIRIGGAA
jgi:hypothetical protein